MFPCLPALRVVTGVKSAFIEFKENGKIERLEMLSTPTLGRFEFVASSLQEPFEYRGFDPDFGERVGDAFPF